jgi:hypothetical protein
MTNMVLGDSTLQSLTPNVNAFLLMLLLSQDDILWMKVLFSNRLVVIFCY